MYGGMAFDWTWEMERRLYDKMCGQLTYCGGEEEEEGGSGKGAIFVVGKAHATILQRQPCLADPMHKLLKVHSGLVIFWACKRGRGGKGHQVLRHSTA